MRKADRLFQVVNLIRVHQPVSAEELAKRLGVSVRTIYRYIDDLSVSGIPVYGVTGVGYSLHESFELPPLTLNRDEFDALMLGVEMLSASAGSELAGAAKALLSKIEAAVPHLSMDPTEASLRVLGVRQNQDSLRYWDRLRRAIQETEAIRISYLSLSGETTSRVVFPLGLFYWGFKWTVGCWCTLRKAYRDFRVDRIESLETVHEAPSPGPEVNLQSYRQFQAAVWGAQQSERGH